MEAPFLRIYAVADIHGKRHRLERVAENIRALSPDVVVMAGDVTNFVRSRKVLSRINRLSVPVYIVRGNTDLPVVEKGLHRYNNVSTLHLKRVTVGDVTITGVSGTALLPFRSQVRYREAHLMRQLMPLAREASVLVAHPPPLGIRDEVMGRIHAGSRGLSRLISICRPPLMICGHIHEGTGTGRIGETMVVNCSMGRKGGGALIEMAPHRVERVTPL